MPTKPLKSSRSDNRLSAVLDAAARLFAGKGYAATSMRDIAEACEMLPGSLYYHFAAKEDLLVAVYEAGVPSKSNVSPSFGIFAAGMGPLIVKVMSERLASMSSALAAIWSSVLLVTAMTLPSI